MPLFDFQCQKCQHVFEELAFDDDDVIKCPKCGSNAVSRLVSAPSPLKTGAFPFKIGPRPAWLDNKALNRNAPCHSGGGCASCAGKGGAAN
ncbi:MAG: zinc ribbon domain-containing protein [Mailhella sp.]|nr:zinc ribbon domain-containing protein [Mailhella sp.]